MCVWEGSGVQVSKDTEPLFVLSVPGSTRRKEQDPSCETQGSKWVGRKRNRAFFPPLEIGGRDKNSIYCASLCTIHNGGYFIDILDLDCP